MQKTLWFVWSVFVYSIVLYLGVAYFFLDSSISHPGVVPAVAGVTILLSVVSGVISVVIRVKLLSKSMDMSSDKDVQKYQTISIINWALSESIAVFGLILVVISGVFYYAIPYCVVSLVLLILHRPAIPSAD